MPEVNFLYLAALTRDVDDAGSSDQLNITINVNGIDVAVAEFVAEHAEAQGYLQHAVAVVSFDSESLDEFFRSHRQPRRRRLGTTGYPAFRSHGRRRHHPYRDGDGPDALAQF